jgi:hypothetical protein
MIVFILKTTGISSGLFNWHEAVDAAETSLSASSFPRVYELTEGTSEKFQ